MTVAIYVRVSTGKQDERNQLPECRRLCEARGWVLPVEVRETASGAKERPEWDRLVELARQGVIRVIVVWSLDRIGRRMFEVIRDAQELARVGCALVSVREPWLDGTSPTRDLTLAIFAWVAQYEHERIRERTIAGLERARAQGRTPGRRRSMPLEVADRAWQLRTPQDDGTIPSWGTVARALELEGHGSFSPECVRINVVRLRP